MPFFPLSPLPADVRYRQAATHPPGRPGQGARRQERRDALASLEVAFGDDVSFLQAHNTHVAVLRLPQPSIELVRLEGAVADVEGRDEEVHWSQLWWSAKLRLGRCASRGSTAAAATDALGLRERLPRVIGCVRPLLPLRIGLCLSQA